MRLQNILFLATVFSLAIGCHSTDQGSGLNIIRGRQLDANGPAASNIVGLSDDGKFIFCTGSIIAEDVVVTAAHCVRDKSNLKVVFGQPKALVDTIDVVSIETYKPYKDAAFPNFDIAWLRLKRKIPAGFQAMEILRDPSSLARASGYQIAGYGIEKTDCLTDDCNGKLLEADTSLQSYHDTPRLMSLLVFKGAALLGFGASCNGDSGGPAYAKIADRWYLIGVTNGATAYLNPDSFVNPSQSCEEGSDTYTFMGDYINWLEKRSEHALIQKAEINPDRAEPAFLTKGEQKPGDFAEPTTWAEWVKYPYHNTQAWNTVNDLLSTLYVSRRHELPSSDLIKIFEDPGFSQSQADQMKTLNFGISDTTRLRYQDQSLDLHPLATWTNLESLTLNDDAAPSFADLDSLTALKSLTLAPSHKAHEKPLDLKPLQEIGRRLTFLELRNYSAAELQTLANVALPLLSTLNMSANAGDENLTVDLSSVKSLENLTVMQWENSSKLILPGELALKKLTIQHRHRSDLHWLDLAHIKSIQTLKIAREVLSSPTVLKLFQNKGIEDLNVSDNGLTANEFPLRAFATVKTAKLDGNQFTESGFLKNLPALKKVDMRSNPLTLADCPADVSCRFDRILNPQNLVDYCLNTVPIAGEVPDNAYSYAYTIKMLFSSQNLESTTYSDESCGILAQFLAQTDSLSLQGELIAFILKSESLDASLLGTLKHLKKLDINLSSVIHSNSLGELSSLGKISLNAVQLNATDFFQKLPALKKIYYNNLPMTTLEPLSSPTVEEIYAYNFGPMLFLDEGKLETIGEGAALPALRELNLNGNPLKDLKGLEQLKHLETLQIAGTHGLDLSPLSTLVGTSVFLGDGYSIESCPVLQGICFSGENSKKGSAFGSDAENSDSSTWYSGQTIPGLGKTIRN